MFFASILALAGCVHYQPKPLSPAQTAADLENRSLTNGALKTFLEKNLHREWTNWPAARWDFDMLTLAAFYYNPSLDVARAEWNVAWGATQTAGGRLNPSVTVTPGYDSGIPGSPSPWIVPLSLDWPVETAGKRRRRIEQANYLSESARLNIATTAWQIRGEVRSSRVNLIATQRRAGLLRRQVELEQEINDRLRSQMQAGALSTAELTATQIALARARADLADAQSQAAEARVRLADAIGVPVAALDSVPLDFDLPPVPAAGHLTSAEARSATLRSRTDILGALAEYAASQSALQLEIAKQYPDLHLGPGYAWNAGSAGDNEWSLGLTLELPVLNRNAGPIAEAKGRRNAAAARFIALQSKIIGEIDRAVAVYDATRKNLQELQSLRAAQEAQQTSVAAQLEAGAADQLERLNAQLEFNIAVAAELDGQARVQLAFGALEDAMQRPISGEMTAAAVFEEKDAPTHAAATTKTDK
jgi:outer membrane protein TolC